MSSVINLPNEGRMVDVVRSALSWADKADLAISFTRCSGLGLLVEAFREVTARRGQIRLLTSTYQNITQPAALEALLRIDGLKCWVQDGRTGFHSKFWLFGSKTRAECWAGSSNLSKGGLADNIEWNLRSSDSSVVAQTARQFDGLLSRPDVFPLNGRLIEDYARRYVEPPPAPMALEDNVTPYGGLPPNEPQREALARLAETRKRGLLRAAVIGATGIGKTYLAAFDCRQMEAKSVLFVSHRLEHLTQAQRTFDKVLGPGRCTVATVQSLKHDKTLLSRNWDYLVIDEFHHVEADGYLPLRAIRNNGHTFLLGLTATPERQDGHDVLEWCDWNIAYEVRLPAAIERGWLLPFHYFAIADDTVDFIKINWRRGMTPELEEALSIPRRVELILNEAIAHGFDGPKRATVGFCAGIEHAKYMARAFIERGQNALAVWGIHSVEEREQIYSRLADQTDPLQWLFVADVLNEGVDIPAINSLLFLRPTESASIFLQQLGRGLRLTPGCEVLTVLDFVGHHRRAWLAMQAIGGITNSGVPVEVGDFVIKPPKSCEVVLQRKTIEMLEKIRRHTSRRDECDEAYRLLKTELAGSRTPMPIDLWERDDLPSYSEFRAAYGDWLGVQAAHQDLPNWAIGLEETDLARQFLRALEADWQAQRVYAYATIWGLARGSRDTQEAYEAFFERFPQWSVERETPFPNESVMKTFEKKLPRMSLSSKGLAKGIVDRIPKGVLESEVEARILPTLNRAFEERHGGVLRKPSDLTLWKFYRRPEIVRHFERQYDPARHNTGILFLGTEIVLIIKLDTSGAIESHQYENRFEDAGTLIWTSQNKMRQDNKQGRSVLDHKNTGRTIRLFVQTASHGEACYLGTASVKRVTGNAPMKVRLALDVPVPLATQRELELDL